MFRKVLATLTICFLLPGSGIARDGGWRFDALQPDAGCGNTAPLDASEQMFLGLLTGERRIVAIRPDNKLFEAVLVILARGAFQGGEFPKDLCLAEVTMQIGDETQIGQLQVRARPKGERRGYVARILFADDAPISQILLQPVNDLRFYGDIYFREGGGVPFGGWSTHLEERSRN